LLLRRSDGTLSGFSSMHVYDVTLDNRAVTVVYSGDTVVEQDAGSTSALSCYWMGAVDYLRHLHDRECLYWLLLVSGYRTYRFLPVYSRFYYPRFDEATPADVQTIMDSLAQERFGDRYDQRAGVVRLAVPAILRDGLRGIPRHRLVDPHIAYFAERNPDHERGDELVCLAVLSEDRLTRLGRRMWAKGRELVSDAITQ
jgi:hypothetical protein